MIRLLSLPLLLLPIPLLAHEHEPNDALFFDKPVANSFPAQFEIEEDLHPEQSSFRVLEVAFLSNEKGERWAMVNVFNTAASPRSIATNHVIALFADGSYRKPKSLSKRIDGGTTETILIPFGVSKTPLVKLLTREF